MTVRFVPLAIHPAHSGDIMFIKKMVWVFASGDTFGGLSPAQRYAIVCHEADRTRELYVGAKMLYPGLVWAASPDSWDRMCATFRPRYTDASFFAPVANDPDIVKRHPQKHFSGSRFGHVVRSDGARQQFERQELASF